MEAGENRIKHYGTDTVNVMRLDKHKRKKQRDFILFFIYLCIAVIVWAVDLINDDRIADINHSNVLEMHVGCRAFIGSWPSFDSYTIVGISESTTLDSDSDYRFFFLIPS